MMLKVGSRCCLKYFQDLTFYDFLSFPWKRESIFLEKAWIPVFTGMTGGLKRLSPENRDSRIKILALQGVGKFCKWVYATWGLILNMVSPWIFSKFRCCLAFNVGWVERLGKLCLALIITFGCPSYSNLWMKAIPIEHEVAQPTLLLLFVTCHWSFVIGYSSIPIVFAGHRA